MQLLGQQLGILDYLELIAADMELTLWARCVYLQVASKSIHLTLCGSITYHQLFGVLDAEGATFRSTTNERSTDISTWILTRLGHIFGGHIMANAPIVPRCKAVWKAARSISQLWAVIVQTWSATPCRLVLISDLMKTLKLDAAGQGQLSERTISLVANVASAFVEVSPYCLFLWYQRRILIMASTVAVCCKTARASRKRGETVRGPLSSITTLWSS